MEKIRVSIVGASGYSGEELIRLLVRHPMAELKVVTSRSNKGAPVSDVFPRFGSLNLHFSEPDVERLAVESDVVFLALPHGLAAEFAAPLCEKGVAVIDVSADFRLKDTAVYKKYYKEEHPAPELLSKAVYGLPERYRELIRKARLVACPGCYPTSCVLPSAPLLAGRLVDSSRIVICSGSGVSGAGRKVELPYIFPECNESFRAYSPVGHRHTPEIEQELAAAAGLPEMAVTFVPHLVPMNRGISTTIVFDLAEGVDSAAVEAAYAAAYSAEPFVRVLPPGKTADTKNVFMTNHCEIGFAVDKRLNRLVVTSAIDNLTKGASGQAIQCMNLIFGLPESSGLA